MDAMISAAARALARGDPLGALKRVALRDDPSAVALRGIGMAQLQDYPRARQLLKRAARGFGAHEPGLRARCVVAEAEVALAMRDLGGHASKLAAAAAVLDARGDRVNALQAKLIEARRLLLLGKLRDADAVLSRLDANALPPALAAVAQLANAESAMRSLRIDRAAKALAWARTAAERAGIPALAAEVMQAQASLDLPAARRIGSDGDRHLRLGDVEALFASATLVVDACRRCVCAAGQRVSLARRPVLFVLAHALAQAWPHDAERNALIACAFRTRRPDETHRARLRVELGRLRTLIAPLARIEATASGFALRARRAREVVLLAPPLDGERGALLALLADGAAWSTSALALALGASQRSVQRALVELESAGQVRSVGRARARRWLSPPLAGFTTILLLPAGLPLP